MTLQLAGAILGVFWLGFFVCAWLTASRNRERDADLRAAREAAAFKDEMIRNALAEGLASVGLGPIPPAAPPLPNPEGEPTR